MDNRLLKGTFASFAIATAVALIAAPAMAQTDVSPLAVTPITDVMTVTSVTVDRTSASTVVVPIRIRDTPGSLLGNDQAVGFKLQGGFIRGDITGPGPLTPTAPTAASRAGGVAAGLTPASEVGSSALNTFAYNASFSEATSLIPWNPSTVGTGDLFLNVSIPISIATTKGVYTVTLNPTFSELWDQTATKEEIGAGSAANNIILTNGTITVTPVELTGFTAE